MSDIVVTLPTLHAGQIRAYRTPGKRVSLCCGRRWGKTEFFKVLAGNGAIKGHPIGWFAPDYKIIAEAYNEVIEMLYPVIKSSSKTEGVIRTINEGRIDFWTLENERAGRSRKYKTVLIDEGAFAKNSTMQAIWERSIAPTLLDYDGKAYVASTPNGANPENFFYNICNDPTSEFITYHAPTSDNPFVPLPRRGESSQEYEIRKLATFEQLKAARAPLVYQQEYEAKFIDWNGVQFFSREKLLVDGKPVPVPRNIDYVFATIDTAAKTGSKNDGTAVIYWARSRGGVGHPLVVLDWDISQIEGSLLEAWMPNVFQRLEYLARVTNAREGTHGAFIEDRSTGIVLNQQARRHGWPCTPIAGKLTELGKDGRAINISGHFHQGSIKISDYAFDKTVIYKGKSANHLITQVCTFRLGDPDPLREDDLLDDFCYGVIVALGDGEGY